MTSVAARALADAPGLANLRHLGLALDVESCDEPGIGTKGLEAILGAPFAAHLRSLSLTEQKLGAGGVAELAGSAALPALRRLAIRREHVTPREVRTLVGTGPLAPELEELTLAGVELDGGQTLTDDEARALAEALRMPKLRRLDLTMNRLSRATVETLLRAPWMQRLDVFDVEDPPGNVYCTERTGGGDDP
jgi:hypothetical protein